MPDRARLRRAITRPRSLWVAGTSPAMTFRVGYLGARLGEVLMTFSFGRRSAFGILGAMALAPAAAKAATAKLPPITIYHLEGRRSERLVWLMEELGFPYELKFKRGDLMGSMAAIRAISP